MRTRGFTLIELLVAMLVTGLLTYFAFDLLGGENKHYTRTRNKVRLQSDAREAVRLIAEDLKNVGYSRGVRLTSVGAEANTSRFGARLDSCGSLLPSEQRVIVNDAANSGQDSITFHFYEPDPATGNTISCRDASGNAIAPAEIAYYYQPGTPYGNLVRSYKPAGAATAVVSTILRNVVAFQVQQGQDPALDPTTAVYTTGGNPDLSTSASWGGGFTLTPHAAGGGQPATMDLTGWTTTSKSATSPDITLPKRTYLNVSYTLRVDPTFTTAYNVDTTKSLIRVGLQTTSGYWDTNAVQTIKIPNITAYPVEYTFSFQPQTSWNTDSTVKFAVQGYLAQASPTATLTLKNIQVDIQRNLAVDSAGSGYLWNNGTGAGNVTASRQIGALKVWVLARSSQTNQEGSQQTFKNIGNWSFSQGIGWTPGDKYTYTLAQNILQVLNNDR